MKESYTYIDIDVFNQLVEDTSSEIMGELVQILYNDSMVRLKKILTAVDVTDFKVMAEEAHALGSSTGTFGAMKLFDLSRALEEKCLKNLATIEDVDTLVAVAEASLGELQNVVKPLIIQ